MSITAAASAGSIAPHKKLYIEPMQSGFESFLVSEILQQKLPIQVVLNEGQADYIMTGNTVKKEGSHKWFHYLTGTAGTTDSIQVAISVIDKRQKTIVWSSNAGDRSFFWGALKKGGERKAALRVVRNFKKALD